MKKKRVCFYARVPDKSLFENVDFYSNDIRILRELGYDVILCNNPREIPNCDLYYIWWWSSGIIPLIKSKRIKKPNIMIGNIHYSDSSKQGYKSRPFYIKKFINYSLRNSDIQIATSKIELRDLKQFKTKNLVLVYHAIDENKYFFSDTPRDKIIFTISRLLKLNVERKKILEIIDAYAIVIKKYPDYLLYIAGRKEDDGYFEVYDKIKKLNLEKKIILTGSISDEEKIKLYHRSKIYVQPTSYEGFGMAIAESMACGTPVVTSPNGAVPEVVGEYAIFVNPDDPSEIANGIFRLIEDDNLYKRLSYEGSKRIIENFSYKERKDKIKKILEDLEI